MIVVSPQEREGVRAPDICYIRESRQGIITDQAIRGAADIVIEVLSETTEEVDRIAKRDQYEATGVPEYWIVDIGARAVLVHYFAQGRQRLFQGEDEFQSEVLKSLGLPSRFSVQEIFEVLR
jgi:Uma2 family endonuclease